MTAAPAISQGLTARWEPWRNPTGLATTQMRLLMEVQHRGEATVGELSQALGSAPGNSLASVRPWRKGLVSRDRSPEDERIVLISLTSQGTGVLQLIEEELSSKFNPVLQEYSSDDFAQIIGGMEKLKEVVTSLHQAFETCTDKEVDHG